MKRLIPTLLTLLALAGGAHSVRGDELPGGPFPASRYSALWEKSPFAVETPVAAESVQYSLVGAAQVDGVSYLSIIDKQSQEHFVVTTTSPSHGLSLVSLTHEPTSTFATMRSNGGILKLPLEGVPVPAGQVVIPQTNGPVINGETPTPVRHRSPRFRRTYPPIYVPEPSAVPNSP
jgi:hypothetical protein